MNESINQSLFGERRPSAGRQRIVPSAFAVTMCVVFLTGWFGFSQARADEVIVLKGSSTKLSVAEGIRKITVTNPSIIDARPAQDGRSVVVSGLAEGASDLVIERLQGAELVRRIVVRPDLQRMLDQVKELLADVEGLEVKTVGDKIVLKGNIVTKAGYDRTAKVVEAYSGVILNISTFDRKEMSKYVEEAILRDIKLDTVSARVVEDTVILEGVVFSEADAARATEMAKLRMPNVRSLLRVQEVMIETDVQFVQVNIDNNTSLGNNVLKSLNVGSLSSFADGKLSYGVNASASGTINALVGSGNGKILAQPHLSTKSGQEGTFLSGGVTFFPVAGNVGGTLEKVEYGVILKVKPTMQGRDSILNEVTVEVSVPTSKGQQGAFSLDKFTTKSTALCKVGESIVLSGLVQTLATRFKEKTPLLGDIPLLNLFFSEKGSKSEKKELVVLISPRPIFPQVSTGQPFSEERKKILEDDGGKK